MTNEKVVTVNLRSSANGSVNEIEFPEVDKYLKEGYYVKNVYTTSPPQSANWVVIVFVLSK